MWLMDGAEASIKKLAAGEEGQTQADYREFDKNFSLNAKKEGQLIPDINENFEQSKAIISEVSKALGNFRTEAKNSKDDYEKQLKNSIGAGDDEATRNGFIRRAKSSAEDLTGQWKHREQMGSYRALFNAVDEELSKSITKRVNALEAKIKKELSEAKINKGKVTDQTVSEIKKEVDNIQKDIDKMITETEGKIVEVQGTIEADNAATKIISDEQELQKNTDIVNDELNKFEDIATSEAWFKFAGSLGQMGTGIYAIGNAVMSLTDESLSP